MQSLYSTNIPWDGACSGLLLTLDMNVHVFKGSICRAAYSHNGSVVKGPLRALVNRVIVYKGVMENPSC